MKTTFETIMNNLGMVECVYNGEMMYRGTTIVTTGVEGKKLEKYIAYIFAKDMGDGWYRASYTRRLIHWELKDGEENRTVVDHYFLPLYALQGFLTDPDTHYDEVEAEEAASQCVQKYGTDEETFETLIGSSTVSDYLEITRADCTEIGEQFPQAACQVSFLLSKEVKYFNPSEVCVFAADYCKDKKPLERSSIQEHWEQVLEDLLEIPGSTEVYCRAGVGGKYTWARMEGRDGSFIRLVDNWERVLRRDVRGVRKVSTLGL